MANWIVVADIHFVGEKDLSLCTRFFEAFKKTRTKADLERYRFFADRDDDTMYSGHLIPIVKCEVKEKEK